MKKQGNGQIINVGSIAGHAVGEGVIKKFGSYMLEEL